MEKQKIFQICPLCKGSGKIQQTSPTTPEDPNPQIVEVDCNQCDGDGHIEWGYLKVQNE